MVERNMHNKNNMFLQYVWKNRVITSIGEKPEVTSLWDISDDPHVIHGSD